MSKTLNKLSLILVSALSANAMAGSDKGEVLVLLSSETHMQLADNKVEPTGYYLNEFGVPAKALVEAGYTLVLATPKGNAPAVDKKSLNVQFFDGSNEYMQDIQTFVSQLPGIEDTLSLSEVLQEGLEQYEGVFVPGGHAPLIDLANNAQVGEILTHFHNEGKPTAAICHGPIALLSAQSQPTDFERGLKQNNAEKAQNWVYEGYSMTIFSTPEEKVFESTLNDAHLLYYPADAMSYAGANMKYSEMWSPNVVVDRELITGQNPFSDDLLAEKLIEQLSARKQ